MAPEFDIASHPSMLSVRFHAEGGSEPDGGPLRFGEGPCRAVSEEPERWTRTLHAVRHADTELSAVLDASELENVQDEMQERVLDILFSLLDEAGVSRAERLVLVLDAGGRVDVEEHPQREKVASLLAAHPRLAERLRELAALALAERGMNDISRAGKLLRGRGEEGGRIFQACLKGGLSHCHLIRER